MVPKNTVNSAFKELFQRNNMVKTLSLISISRHDPARRVYLFNNRIYKILLHEHATTDAFRENTLLGEYEILKILSNVSGVPNEVKIETSPDSHILSYRFIEGVPLCDCMVSHFGFIMLLLKAIVVVCKISVKGVAHNDLTPYNIIVGSDGIYIVDFDQSIRLPIPYAFLSNFLGVNKKGKAYCSVLRLLILRYKESLSQESLDYHMNIKDKIIKKVRRMRASFIKPLPNNASYKLAHLHEAWKMARKSDANAPGEFLCYYSHRCDGFHLPGERPWLERWETLKSVTDYKGKRILELGCNLSLLSCHLLKESGAISALCVDHDWDILSAAQKVAAAYQVTPIYKRIDFDDANDWETDLLLFKPDIAILLSVLNWVEDKNRLLKFIGKFNEVVFEGHDSTDVERGRLREIGFSTIEYVTTSERNRPILYAKK